MMSMYGILMVGTEMYRFFRYRTKEQDNSQQNCQGNMKKSGTQLKINSMMIGFFLARTLFPVSQKPMWPFYIVSN